jgi:hypothetical protein
VAAIGSEEGGVAPPEQAASESPRRADDADKKTVRRIRSPARRFSPKLA